MASPLAHEKVWFNKHKCEEAERQYFENLAKVSTILKADFFTFASV